MRVYYVFFGFPDPSPRFLKWIRIQNPRYYTYVQLRSYCWRERGVGRDGYALHGVCGDLFFDQLPINRMKIFGQQGQRFKYKYSYSALPLPKIM